MKAVPVYLLGVIGAAGLSLDRSPVVDNEIVGDKDQRWI